MRRRKVGRWVGLLVAVYVLLAALPYAFPPASREAQPAFSQAAWDGAQGERATILTTGEEAMAARLNLIANAQTSLDVATYLYADDESGRDVAAALLDAADRGVRVRVVVDGLVGRLNFLGGDLGYALGTHPNIEVRCYNPVNLLAPWGLSARFHEKYVIADGRTFVLGGRNISDEFLTPEEHPDYNYDLDVLMCSGPGGAAEALRAYFDRLWEERCAPAYEQAPAWRRAGVEALAEELRLRWESLEQEWARAVAPADWEALTVPVEGWALLTNPTDWGVKAPALWDDLMALIRGAKERVWIQTPYVVLSAQMRDSLRAALEGVPEAALLTNSRAGGNNIVASADAVFHRGMALSMPLTCYELQAPRSMHTKAMLVDGEVSVFGSFNFDMRSAYSDTEVMLAVRGEALCGMAEDYMLEMRAMALPVAADGGYGAGEAEALETPWLKNLLILAASPLVSLFRFLV